MSGIRAALSEAAAAIRTADSIVTIGHVGPDGDALGSMLALAIAARDAGKDAVATFGQPFVLADRYRYLDLTTLIPEADVGARELAIVVDCGIGHRLGSAQAVAAAADRVVVIDHHISGDDDFGDVRVVDATAAATAQLVFYLLEDLGWPISAAVADALYTGLVTDTGRFQYSNTTTEVHRIAARLLDAGVAPDVVGQHVFEEAPFGYLGVAAAVLERASFDPGASLVWSVLTVADLTTAGIAYEEADGLIDLIRVADGAQVACLLREVGEGRLKGSLRSRGRVDVSALANRIGGGGHHNAAGFTTSMSVDDTVAFIKAHL